MERVPTEETALRPTRHRSAQIQNRHLRSRLFLASAQRLQELHNPTHRQDFWLAKLNGNAARDKLHQRALKKLGWRVIVIWECEMRKDRILQLITARIGKIVE